VETRPVMLFFSSSGFLQPPQSTAKASSNGHRRHNHDRDFRAMTNLFYLK
jgi:hypothetical protein